MKKLVMVLLAIVAFSGLQSIIVQYQMSDSGMTVANNESYGMGGGGRDNKNE